MAGYSLHIGLNHVDPAAYGGWDGALDGCINDAVSMEQIAASQGFTTASLIDDQATSQTVVGEIGNLANTTSAGDIVLISYSGHGGQVDDYDGEEADALDETWCLWDRQLVDDELYYAWSQFPAGVRVLVFSDSCHSGTVVRDPGGPPIVERRMPEDVQLREREDEGRSATYRMAQERAGRGKKGASDIACSVLLISGCQDDQLSADGNANGLFTGTLLDVWADGAFDGDYPAFHSAILAKMPSDQSPVLNTDVGAYDAAYVAQRPFTV